MYSHYYFPSHTSNNTTNTCFFTFFLCFGIYGRLTPLFILFSSKYQFSLTHSNIKKGHMHEWIWLPETFRIPKYMIIVISHNPLVIMIVLMCFPFYVAPVWQRLRNQTLNFVVIFSRIKFAWFVSLMLMLTLDRPLFETWLFLIPTTVYVEPRPPLDIFVVHFYALFNLFFKQKGDANTSL